MTCCPTCGQSLVTFAGLYFNYDTGDVRRADAAIHLSPYQADMFQALLEKYPRVASRGYLMDAIYGPRFDHPAEKVLAVRASGMNKKLRKLGLEIRAVWRRGYELREAA